MGFYFYLSKHDNSYYVVTKVFNINFEVYRNIDFSKVVDFNINKGIVEVISSDDFGSDV